jgi:hypothetical protein
MDPTGKLAAPASGMCSFTRVSSSMKEKVEMVASGSGASSFVTALLSGMGTW